MILLGQDESQELLCSLVTYTSVSYTEVYVILYTARWQ